MAAFHPTAQDKALSKPVDRTQRPSWIARALGGMRQGWRAYARFKRLSMMSDGALSKRGLSRDQIAREAFFGDSDL